LKRTDAIITAPAAMAAAAAPTHALAETVLVFVVAYAAAFDSCSVVILACSVADWIAAGAAGASFGSGIHGGKGGWVLDVWDRGTRSCCFGAERSARCVWRLRWW